jgi:hypothetical protein
VYEKFLEIENEPKIEDDGQFDEFLEERSEDTSDTNKNESKIETNELWNHSFSIGPRTNNRCEDSHSKLNCIIGCPHPNIFKVVEIFPIS